MGGAGCNYWRGPSVRKKPGISRGRPSISPLFIMLFSPIKTSLLGLAGSVLLLAGCQKEVVTPPGNTTPANVRPLSTAERQTVGSSNDFAYRAFDALRQAAPADNLFISPLSISAALTMAYNGADGSTKAAMKQTLGFQPQTDQQINQSYQDLFALFGGLDSRVTFTAANSIWHGQQYQLAAPFVQKNQTYFGATVQGVDFGAAATKDVINHWVSTNTQGRIPTIVNQTTVDDVMYLINAIYFKGAWTYRFDPQLTRPEPFRFENGSTRNVEFMTLLRGKYLRYQDAQQQVIDLPYGNRQFSMTLVVPQGSNTLASVAGRLNSSQLASWLGAADTTNLELHLPKFRLEYEKELSESLSQLGMDVAFGSQANFSQMLAGGPGNLAISEVKHKTFLEVNEEGTEAAAATSVGIVVTSLPPSVRIDRPFVFLIREKSSNAILFIGQLTNP
jgi:serine protease inhibitor